MSLVGRRARGTAEVLNPKFVQDDTYRGKSQQEPEHVVDVFEGEVVHVNRSDSCTNQLLLWLLCDNGKIVMMFSAAATIIPVGGG